MKSWKSNNYINRFTEAEESAAYLDDLKKLINAELVAHLQYEIASKGIMGDHLSYLQNHFSEHADEEKDHYEQLVDALMQRGGKPEVNLISTVNEALPATEELVGLNSDELREFFIRAEQNAIEAYQTFYDEIEDIDKDLADIINGIISDERDHKLDFTRMEKEDVGEIPEEPAAIEESKKPKYDYNEVMDYLEDTLSYTDYNGRIDGLMEDFGMTRKEAAGWIDEWNMNSDDDDEDSEFDFDQAIEEIYKCMDDHGKDIPGDSFYEKAVYLIEAGELEDRLGVEFTGDDVEALEEYLSEDEEG